MRLARRGRRSERVIGFADAARRGIRERRCVQRIANRTVRGCGEIHAGPYENAKHRLRGNGLACPLLETVGRQVAAAPLGAQSPNGQYAPSSAPHAATPGLYRGVLLLADARTSNIEELDCFAGRPQSVDQSFMAVAVFT